MQAITIFGDIYIKYVDLEAPLHHKLTSIVRLIHDILQEPPNPESSVLLLYTFALSA